MLEAKYWKNSYKCDRKKFDTKLNLIAGDKLIEGDSFGGKNILETFSESRDENILQW